jgi:putative tricarboxylic transport membrane protein
MREPEESSVAERSRSAISTKTMEVVAAVVFLALGLLVMWDSSRLGAKWGPDGPEAGYFPFYIGLIISVSAVVNAIRAFLGKDIKEPSFVSVDALKMVLTVFIPTVIYVLLIDGVGPIPGLGIYVPSILFIAAFMMILGRYKWLKTAIVSICVVVVFFLMFEVWFKVPLPKGPLEAALGFA